MEKELMFKAKDYLTDRCYGDVYVKYFFETDDLFIRFNFDGIEIKMTVKEFIQKINDGQSISMQMDDTLKRVRFILCNIMSARYFKES